jgi:cellulose synthase/poly-beta-1,6-N-acetylglucosamine synthase-like glycosyltransferase
MQRYKTIRLIEERERKGKASALNILLNEAKGDIIILTDADVLLAREAINNLLPYFSDPQVGAVSGRPIPLNKRGDFWGDIAWLSFDAMHSKRVDEMSKGELIHPSGYLYALGRGIIQEVPKDTVTEDLMVGYLTKSKGFKIAYAPNAQVYVKFPTRITDYLIQKIRTRAGWWQLQRTSHMGISKARSKPVLTSFRSPLSLCLAFLDAIAWIGGFAYCIGSKRPQWKTAPTTKRF